LRYSVRVSSEQGEVMSNSAESPRYVLARQLPEIRARVGYASAQDLADRVAQLGGRLDRAAISKIESRSRNVSLDEALLLAVALNVAPVHLFLPRADDEEVEIARGLPSVPAVEARAWFRGQAATVPTVNEKLFRTEVPESEWEERKARVEEAQEAYLRAERQLRVAKAMLDTISDDYGKMDPPKMQSAFGSVSQRDDSERRKMMERKLSAAYERVAEATVEMQDAKTRFVRIRSEEMFD
jgi:transcriptional regulator with XRE-family HTH domain